eukprot:699259-Alexandrium_andersonii.AAC.1
MPAGSRAWRGCVEIGSHEQSRSRKRGVRIVPGLAVPDTTLMKLQRRENPAEQPNAHICQR